MKGLPEDALAAHRRLNKQPNRDLLTEILDFGPDGAPAPSADITERIRKVKEKIEEINQRIARLTSAPK
ncbi:hypothetical protein K2X33_06580 [bacterium]|nr:hypothetical protein [bacterium]